MLYRQSQAPFSFMTEYGSDDHYSFDRMSYNQFILNKLAFDSTRREVTSKALFVLN